MRILALDLGTKTGWALYDDGIIQSGTWQLCPESQRRWEGGGMRYVRFVDLLSDLPRPDRIAYEEVRRHKGTTAAHTYGGFQSSLMAWCERNKIPYEAYPVAQIKRHATGKGNASKEAMIEAAKKFGEVEDDNHADALMLMSLVCEVVGVSV